MPLTPAERSMRARLAAHTSHARHDSKAITANARAAFLNRFEREVDPDGTLAPDERARRAEHAKKAYFQRMAFARERARQAKRSGGEPSPPKAEPTSRSA